MNDELPSDEHLIPNYSAPSPQADEVRIVIETLEGIVRGGWHVDDWCEFYEYDKRQYDYYVNAKRTEDDPGRLMIVIVLLDDGEIYIDDNPGVSIMEIRAKARRLKSRIGNLGVIVVDYLQLMTGRSAAESRQVEISEISRGLKLLARDLETPVIGISQLSRSLESRQDKRPMLSDLRESGSIEQDADLVMFIYRDEMYNPESNETGLAEINLAKNRNGPVERVRLAYMPNFTKFADLSRADESDSAIQKAGSINEPGNF